MVYPIAKWDVQLRAKLAKGYTQVIGHGSAVDVDHVGAGFVAVDDADVKELVVFLLKSSQRTVSLNYLSAGDVTEAQIEHARWLIGRANQEVGSPASVVNILLEKLYRTIPRKMADTRKFFLQDGYRKQFLIELLQSEQSLLDTLESQARSVADGGGAITLESLGVDIRVATSYERAEISRSTDFKVGKHKVFRVVNRDAERRFRSDSRVRLLYHGTRNGNWLSVLQDGLKIRPAGVPTTGSMFGSQAIYFANKARKSIGYTSLKGSCWAGGAEDRAYLALLMLRLTVSGTCLMGGRGRLG
jgi:poly [ADP-ribose] polymerase